MSTSVRSLFQVGNLIGDADVVGVSLGPRDHVGGEIEAERMRSALRPRKTRKPAEPAAEIDHPLAGEVGQQCTDCRPFRRPVEAVLRTGEPAVAFEEFGMIIDILSHAASLASPWMLGHGPHGAQQS